MDSHYFYYLMAGLVSLVMLIAGSASITIRFRKLRNSVRLPPGPPSWPVIGHLHLLGRLPHQSLRRLSQRYGSLIYLRLGSVPTIVASSPDLAREVLKVHDHVFATRPKTAAGKYIAYNNSDMALAPYGPYWRQIRKICLTELFNSRSLDYFRVLREEELTLVIRSILEMSEKGKAIDLNVKLSSLACNIISRMVMNKKFFGEGSESNLDATELVELMKEVSELSGVFNIGDYIPSLEWLDLQGYRRRMKKIHQRFDAYLQRIIQEHRHKMENSSPTETEDFVDVLLSREEDSQFGIKLEDDHMKAILLDMFTAGTDTSAFTIEWALAELLKNPRSLEELQKELDFVAGGVRQIEEMDVPQLPYLQAVVKETMRLHPAAPLLLPHESTRACEVAGYEIPAKTRLFVNVWAIGRHDKVWRNAAEFQPERFIGSEIDVRGQNFELLPFGSGRRGCPGMSLALSTVHVSLARLVHGFEWSVWWAGMRGGPEKEALDMEEKFGVAVARANPLVLVPTARLPTHLY